MSIDWYAAIQTLAVLIAAGSVFWAAQSYRAARGQLEFSVMISCVTRFQSILSGLESREIPIAGGSNKTEDCAASSAGKQYIDLCNEELFYFEMDYLPRPIIEEWIDGMLEYLPLRCRDGSLIYDDYRLKINVYGSYFDSNPRIARIFTVERRLGLESAQERQNYILQIVENIKATKRRQLWTIANEARCNFRSKPSTCR